MNPIVMVIIYLVLQMCCVWMLYRFLKNPSVVDASWSIGLMISGLIYLWSMNISSRNMVITALLILWALRLAGYLWYTRLHQGHIDKRYTTLSNDWKINQSLGFFLNFQLQGFLVFIISFVFYWIGSSNDVSLTRLDIIALIIVIGGILGESIADLQLYGFKKKAKGGVCHIGLWQYSRHPNYFFDWVAWLGFTLFALQSHYGLFGLLSLMVLYLIFTRITGPLTERGSVKSRGQIYIDYQKQTPMFFPWFKRKIDFE